MPNLKINQDTLEKLKKLKGYLIEGSLSDTIDRVLIHAGYNSKFWERWNEIVQNRPELAKVPKETKG